jgi:hypothetical protein
MVRWGFTKQGRQRFCCQSCKISGIKKRPDQSLRRTEILFERWLLKTETLERLAHLRHTKPSALIRHFNLFWHKIIVPLPYQGNGKILLIDGIILSRECCILIAIDGDGIPITWLACKRECSNAWRILFEQVKKAGVNNPSVIVSDAQKGLIKAKKTVFPKFPHQRCMTHVVRLAQAWLTRQPKTLAGQELRCLVKSLYDIAIRSDAKIFIEKFNNWLEKYHNFLKEMSMSLETKRRWYTHRRLRAIRSLLLGALPDLFTFLEIPNTPRTTNKLEGGVNSPIKALLRHHRGMPISHRQALVFRFLRARQIQKYQH